MKQGLKSIEKRLIIVNFLDFVHHSPINSQPLGSIFGQKNSEIFSVSKKPSFSINL